MSHYNHVDQGDESTCAAPDTDVGFEIYDVDGLPLEGVGDCEGVKVLGTNI